MICKECSKLKTMRSPKYRGFFVAHSVYEPLGAFLCLTWYLIHVFNKNASKALKRGLKRMLWLYTVSNSVYYTLITSYTHHVSRAHLHAHTRPSRDAHFTKEANYINACKHHVWEIKLLTLMCISQRRRTYTACVCAKQSNLASTRISQRKPTHANVHVTKESNSIWKGRFAPARARHFFANMISGTFLYHVGIILSRSFSLTFTN